MQGETTRITLLVAQTLEQLGIPYAVGGSLASSLHGVMRATLDVDIVADMRSEHVPPLVAALAPEFYADDEMMRDAIEHRSSFHLIHYKTAFKVDIFIRKLRAFDRMQKAAGPPGIQEDLHGRKSIGGREGTRTRDLTDVNSAL